MEGKEMNLSNKTILVTGVAGFIGANLVLKLIGRQSLVNIIGVDNMNDYYDVSIKKYRLNNIESMASVHPKSAWNFIEGSIADKEVVDFVFEKYKPSIVVNLAAQAGVRYSITNPEIGRAHV